MPDVRLGKMAVLPPDPQPEDISGVGGKSMSEMATSHEGEKGKHVSAFLNILYIVVLHSQN